MNATYKLFTAQTANATGTAVDILPLRDLRVFDVFVYGTFDTCSVTFEISPDGTNYVPIGVAVTAANHQRITAAASKIRAVMASVGGSTSVTVEVIETQG